jgi:hypothetical protein
MKFGPLVFNFGKSGFTSVGTADRALVVELAHPSPAGRPARPHLVEQPLTVLHES